MSTPPPPLTLGRLMAAIAVLGFGFAFLPTILSNALTIALVGILGLQACRLPLITERGGLWWWIPWSLWSLALVVCPIATAVVGSVYERVGPPAYSGPLPWAAGVVDALARVQLVVEVVASIAVVLLARPGFRWLAWVAILVIGVVDFVVGLGAAMSTTGVYL